MIVPATDANPQYGNVGNPGDILKHGALLALVRLMQMRCEDAPVAYLETHAFVAEAPLAYEAWEASVDELCRRCPGYGLYRHVERPYTAQGAYLCSVGLAQVSLTHARWFLSEREETTRAILWRQLAERGVAVEQLLDDAAGWAGAKRAPETGGLMALIDPFCLDAADWSAACQAVARVWTPQTPGLLEVFTFDKDAAETRWPEPPTGWEGPVAVLDHGPYHLALYATPGMIESAVQVLEPLGWDNGAGR